ncbi:hypothetical protein IAU59_006835 [Kwoniella sp. CBS 9459]
MSLVICQALSVDRDAPDPPDPSKPGTITTSCVGSQYVLTPKLKFDAHTDENKSTQSFGQVATSYLDDPYKVSSELSSVLELARSTSRCRRGNDIGSTDRMTSPATFEGNGSRPGTNESAQGAEGFFGSAGYRRMHPPGSYVDEPPTVVPNGVLLTSSWMEEDDPTTVYRVSVVAEDPGTTSPGASVSASTAVTENPFGDDAQDESPTLDAELLSERMAQMTVAQRRRIFKSIGRAQKESIIPGVRTMAPASRDPFRGIYALEDATLLAQVQADDAGTTTGLDSAKDIKAYLYTSMGYTDPQSPSADARFGAKARAGSAIYPERVTHCRVPKEQLESLVGFHFDRSMASPWKGDDQKGATSAATKPDLTSSDGVHRLRNIDHFNDPGLERAALRAGKSATICAAPHSTPATSLADPRNPLDEYWDPYTARDSCTVPKPADRAEIRRRVKLESRRGAHSHGHGHTHDDQDGFKTLRLVRAGDTICQISINPHTNDIKLSGTLPKTSSEEASSACSLAPFSNYNLNGEHVSHRHNEDKCVTTYTGKDYEREIMTDTITGTTDVTAISRHGGTHRPGSGAGLHHHHDRRHDHHHDHHHAHDQDTLAQRSASALRGLKGYLPSVPSFSLPMPWKRNDRGKYDTVPEDFELGSDSGDHEDNEIQRGDLGAEMDLETGMIGVQSPQARAESSNAPLLGTMLRGSQRAPLPYQLYYE